MRVLRGSRAKHTVILSVLDNRRPGPSSRHRLSCKCCKFRLLTTTASLAEAQAMPARLLRADHSRLLTRSSTFRSRPWKSPAFGSRGFCRRSKLLPLPPNCHQRPDAGRPVWRQRTDQVVERLTAWVNNAADQFDLAVMPRERGDVRDRALMALSLAVLVLLSMHLFRIYLHLYNAAGLRTIREIMMP